MKLHDIREMIKLVNQSSIEELEWEQDGKSIIIKKAAPEAVVTTLDRVVPEAVENDGYQQAAATAEEVEATGLSEPEVSGEKTTFILSSTVGLFNAAVTPGQSIQKGDLIGTLSVNSLQLSEEVRSTEQGEVTEILVADGEIVDFGKALVALKMK